MQGNDLGTQITKRVVVVLCPLLAQPPLPNARRTMIMMGRSFGKRAKMAELAAAEYTLNTNMLTWIAHMGREFNTPTEVWSFLPKDVTDVIAPRIERVAGRYITSYTTWTDPSEAYKYLRSERDIVTVYDADVDRVQRYWHMRGAIVMPGTTP